MAVWNPIPGETPIDDASGLLPRNVTTRARLNEVEADNIRKAILHYLAARPTRRQAPFTLSWCFKLHKQMLGRVWRWAGTKRLTDLNIGVPVHRIEVDLQTLMDDLAFWRAAGDMDLIEQAARLHHRAVQIHPFLTGNGRWSRLLANIHLRQSAGTVTIWPEESVGDASVVREEYLAALKRADAGEYGPLINLHRRFTQM